VVDAEEPAGGVVAGGVVAGVVVVLDGGAVDDGREGCVTAPGVGAEVGAAGEAWPADP
jgi:hypothetical protein